MMTKENAQELLASIERVQEALKKMIAEAEVRRLSEQEKNDIIVARERYRSGV